ncbi:response regulator [Idiomarina sp. A28L]|uniref:LuxR C-terminal-related transcriptional regulator n=1 Tax=Idiomarina sp. A28L TaxID=1036674 RepID=UPI0002138900|nr:LuxR C-terminal-related transcriptional regulator [Idiomarina sp. A28L]EGN75765.1 response regulator [Idiomarina sp. A28L]
MSDVIVALPKGIRHTGVVNELGELRWKVHVAQNRPGLEALVSKRAANVLVLSEEFAGSATRALVKKLHKLNPALRVMLWCDKLNHALDYKFNEPAISGYLLNEASIDEVNHGCRVVSLGQSYTPNLLRQMAKRYQGPLLKHPLLSSLSRREQQIFQLISTGLTVSSISERLYISRKTVNTFRYRLYRKLDVENDVQITHLAYKYGLINHDISNKPLHQAVIPTNVPFAQTSAKAHAAANDEAALITA